jgi:hypothetical protein
MRHSVKSIVVEYVGFMRMMQLWFHGAHHLSRGTSFAGDHVNLYGKIYQDIEDQIDGAIEKAIGLFGEECGCPLAITETALEIMSKYPSPYDLNPPSVAAVGLKIEKDWLAFSQKFYDMLKSSGTMTLGLDDFIMANANSHETNVYLLQQRIRQAIG